MDVSVIIPVYNGEKFIVSAIQSVLQQTLPAREILVIDDASEDNTPQILKQFDGQGRIRVMRIDNLGVSRARNIGILKTSGEWVAFLDADDVWLPGFLKKQAEMISRYPEVGFSCSNHRLFDHSLQRRIERPDPKSDPDMVWDAPWNPFKTLLKNNFFGTTSVAMVKRIIFGAVGLFDMRYSISQDYDLWLRCSLAAPFFFLPDVLVEKGVHDTNLTRNVLKMNQEDEEILMDIRHKYRDRLYESGLWADSSLALARKRYQIGNNHYESKRFLRAFDYFLRGFFVCRTWKNFGLFVSAFSRKAVRFVSFGLISRERGTS